MKPNATSNPYSSKNPLRGLVCQVRSDVSMSDQTHNKPVSVKCFCPNANSWRGSKLFKDRYVLSWLAEARSMTLLDTGRKCQSDLDMISGDAVSPSRASVALGAIPAYQRHVDQRSNKRQQQGTRNFSTVSCVHDLTGDSIIMRHTSVCMTSAMTSASSLLVVAAARRLPIARRRPFCQRIKRKN